MRAHHHLDAALGLVAEFPVEVRAFLEPRPVGDDEGGVDLAGDDAPLVHDETGDRLLHVVDLDESAADDPMVTFDLTDQVRETIQQTLYSVLVTRRSVFF